MGKPSARLGRSARPHPGHIRRSWGPGWALVGDAGDFKDPITTHGITDALRDAELLSAQLVNSLSGRLPETVARWRYEATRHRLSHELFTATEDVASYDGGIDVLPSILRRVSTAMNHEVDYLQALPDPRVDAA